jgi:hypothetical protein
MDVLRLLEDEHDDAKAVFKKIEKADGQAAARLISALEPSDEAWQPKVKVLQENTEHHIEEEEGEHFAKVRKIWNAAKREQVGRQMEEMKERQKKANKERPAA